MGLNIFNNVMAMILLNENGNTTIEAVSEKKI